MSDEVVNTWFRFPWGTDFILQRAGFKITEGFDAVVYGNIPGGGMSRSASLSVNLLLTFLEVNGQKVEKDFDVVELTQAVENDYVGSPCGQLDQIMIYFAKAGMGTHFDPATNNIKYVPLGANAEDFCIVGLDTGTDRPGLDKSTYKVRRQECDEFGALLKEKGYIQKPFLAEIQDDALYQKVLADFGASHPDHCKRLTYIYHSQISFYKMLEAWRNGDIATVGRIFREDGVGLRDEYVISGPELETMCDIVRTVPGVYGERMLGGGDKGASGCLVRADQVEALQKAVDTAYPRSRPDFADKYAVHPVKVCDGVRVFKNVL